MIFSRNLFRFLLFLFLTFLFFSCASLNKENIEIPKDVRSKSVVKEIPKEQQKESQVITVVGSEKVEEQIKVEAAPLKVKKTPTKKNKPKPILKMVKNPFKIGEVMKWDLYYIGIRAASLTVEIKPFVELNGRKAFHFNGIAQTTSLMKYIYRVYDVIDSYVDFEYFTPLKMTLTMNESKQNVSMVINYDHIKEKSSFWKKRIDAKGQVTETRREDDFTAMAQDIFSSLYYMRTHDLKIGDKVKFVVHDNGKNWTLTLAVLKNEKVWTRLGEVDCLLLNPTVERNGEKFTKGSMSLWVTNDAKKVPVKFEAQVKIGSMKGYIKDYLVPKS